MLGGTPCKDCEVRFVGCHQYCEEYEEWRKMNSAAKKHRQNEAEVTTALYDMKSKLAHKYGKSKRS